MRLAHLATTDHGASSGRPVFGPCPAERIDPHPIDEIRSWARGPMALWRHAGIPVVDAHVHVNRFDRMTPGARATIESNPTFPQMRRFVADPDAFIAHMDAEGIQQAWLI